MPDVIFIPRPFDSDDYESMKIYFDTLKSSRKLALDKPLTTNLELRLKLVCKAKPSPTSRPFPWFAKNEGVYSCSLLEPLQEGPDKYSQVWIARVLPSDKATPSEGTKIVLKIFQPSLSFLPDPDTIWEDRYAKPEQLARNEDLAYSELINIQGIYVPYYFGFQEIITPCEEGAWVLAMEYIEGVTIDKLVYGVRVEDQLSEDKSLKEKNIDLFSKVYRSMAETMNAIIKANVCLLDPRVLNFIYCQDTGTIVAIDFALVYFGYGGDYDKRNEFNRVAQKFLDCFGPYMEPVHEWVNNNMPEDQHGYYKRLKVESDDDVDDNDDGQWESL